MIKNVIFDVGRVLAAYDYQSYLNRKKYSEEEQQIIKKAMFESQTWLLADRGEVPEGKLLELFVNNDPEHEELIRDAYEHMEEVIWLFPYTMQWVKNLKEQEYKVYVLSNYGEELLARTKSKLEFLPYMDGVVFSCESHFLKPEADSYHYLCRKYNICPADSVFLDDRLENVEGARAYGIHGILFESYEQADQKLKELIHLYEEDDRMSYCVE